MNKKVNTPENVSRLVDLIKVNDPKYLTAFYYSLRNTLVANDLEQASRIAYGQSRNRVVTLKGEIIEVSGTMSGGGQPLRGRMGSKLTEEYSSDAIKKMQDNLAVDEQALKEALLRKQELEPQVYELKNKLDKAKNEFNTLKNEINYLKEQIKEYKKFEANCLQKIKEITPDEAKQAKLEEALEKLKNDFEKADKLAAKFRDENEELHKSIVEISKKILDEPKTNLKKIETKIADLNTEITNLTVEIKSSKRNLINSEKKLVSLKEDLEMNENNLEKYKKRLESIDQDGKEVIEAHEKCKQELEEFENEIKELSKVIKQQENKVQKLEADRIDLKHKLEKANEELKQAEHEYKHYDHLIKSLRLHNIKDMEKNFSLDDESTIHEGPELKRFDADDFEGLSLDSLKRDIHRLEENLKSQTPNLLAIQNYKELMKKFTERMLELEEINAQKEKLATEFEDLRKKD